MQQNNGQTASAVQKRRGALASWFLYDWASSAFPTIIITFIFSAYVTKALAETPELGTSYWGWAMGISGLAIAVASPLFGAVVDQMGRRRPWLVGCSLLAIFSGFLLWTVEPHPAYLLPALIYAAVGNFGFETAQVFYNASLGDVAPKGKIGRISGWAWGLGYAGGLTCLMICLFVFVQPEVAPFGLDKSNQEHVRATGPFVSLWYLIFALPLFLLLPDRPASGLSLSKALSKGLSTLGNTLKALPKEKGILRFLIARMLYIDGLNTLFAFGGIYAAGTFGFSFEEILIFGILINVTSGLGAFAFAWVDDWIGPKKTIVLSLIGLSVLGIALLLISDKILFYVLGCGMGIFVGPVQASSRSLMVRLAPPQLSTEYFGLFALSGRITAFLGPILVGSITFAMDSQRWGMSVIMLFYLAGLLLLLPLKEPKAQD
ncbi:MFS transporter [Rhodovibrionaceae bacterium A322]